MRKHFTALLLVLAVGVSAAACNSLPSGPFSEAKSGDCSCRPVDGVWHCQGADCSCEVRDSDFRCPDSETQR